MAKSKISEEDFELLEDAQRHDEMMSVLNKIAEHNGSDKLEESIRKQSEQIARVLQKTPSADTSQLKPLINELIVSVNELKTLLVNKPMPTSFRVQRNQAGLIERVIVERLSGN